MTPSGKPGKEAPVRPVGEQILASLPSGVLAAGADGRVLTLNPAAREFLRLAPEAGMPGEPLAAIGNAKPFAEIFDEIRETGAAVLRRSVFLAYDDLSRREIGLNASLLDGPAAFNGVIFLFTDMTERRQLERAAHLNRQLADLGELTAGVVHELRTPVMVVSGMSELILRQAEPGTSVHNNATVILRECRNLDGLIGQFLGFARPFDISAARCSPDELARRAVKLCTLKANHKSVKIVPKIDDDLPVIHADGGKIVQVLVNLVNNAIDAVEEGKGVINVFARTEDDGQVAFAVVDNGPGLQLGDEEDVFKPFVTKKEGGTGLGLSIVSRIVHAHKGTVAYSTDRRGGACFTVVLPAAKG